MKDRGIDALVNDSLVGLCLTFGAYIVGILCAAFGYLYVRCKYFSSKLAVDEIRSLTFVFALVLVPPPLSSPSCLPDTDAPYNTEGEYSAVIILFSFLIGLQAGTFSDSFLPCRSTNSTRTDASHLPTGLALAQALEGGVSTIFVCLGEDPQMYVLLSTS